MIVYGPLIGRKQIGEVEKFPQKVMIWLEDIASLRLFEKGTVYHHRYIEEVLTIALRLQKQ